MTVEEIMNLINRSLFADLGYIAEDGRHAIRRVFCVWHNGVGRHLISTNTSSGHVRRLTQNPDACLYFSDSESFEGVCLTGRAVPTRDEAYRELLWNDGDEKYYPLGMDDPDYCVIEFTADRADYYRYDGKGTLGADEIKGTCEDKTFINGYAESHAAKQAARNTGRK